MWDPEKAYCTQFYLALQEIIFMTFELMTSNECDMIIILLLCSSLSINYKHANLGYILAKKGNAIATKAVGFQ